MTQSSAQSPQLPLGSKTRRAWQAHARSRDDELRPDTDRLPVRSRRELQRLAVLQRALAIIPTRMPARCSGTVVACL